MGGDATVGGPSRYGSTELTGRAALVTGASRGIGLAVCRALLGRGMSLAALARDAARLEHAAGQLRDAVPGHVILLPCDVGDETQVQAAVATAVEALGGLDVLVNSAGVSTAADASAAGTTADDWQRMVRTNLTGTYLTSRAALPYLRRDHGQIVNVLSLGAHRVRPGSVLYAATKHGALALTEGLAQEERDDVRVSSVSPGPVDTEIWDLKDEPPAAGTRALMLAASDVADAVVWLLERPWHVHVADIRIAPRVDPFRYVARGTEEEE